LVLIVVAGTLGAGAYDRVGVCVDVVGDVAVTICLGAMIGFVTIDFTAVVSFDTSVGCCCVTGGAT
jgi:hypothetical protein